MNFRKMGAIWMVLAAAAGAAGCSRSDSRRQDYLSAHPGLPSELKSAINQGILKEGMTVDQAEASLGAPLEKKQVVLKDQTVELWQWKQFGQPSSQHEKYGKLLNYTDGWQGRGVPSPTGSEIRPVHFQAWVRDNKVVAWEYGWRNSRDTWKRGGDLASIYEERPLVSKMTRKIPAGE